MQLTISIIASLLPAMVLAVPASRVARQDRGTGYYPVSWEMKDYKEGKQLP
jgi:soluble cytochrome b562